MGTHCNRNTILQPMCRHVDKLQSYGWRQARKNMPKLQHEDERKHAKSAASWDQGTRDKDLKTRTTVRGTESTRGGEGSQRKRKRNLFAHCSTKLNKRGGGRTRTDNHCKFTDNRFGSWGPVCGNCCLAPVGPGFWCVSGLEIKKISYNTMFLIFSHFYSLDFLTC